MTKHVKLSTVQRLVDLAILELLNGSRRIVNFHHGVCHDLLFWPLKAFVRGFSLVSQPGGLEDFRVRRNGECGLALEQDLGDFGGCLCFNPMSQGFGR